MRLVRQFVFLFVVLFAIEALSLQAQDWEHFRAAYPYHIQTIALSDDHRTLIISEPPPSVMLQQIRDLDPALSHATVRAERIGVDGWVADVVVDLPPLDPQQLREVVDHLQQLLFGTSYKAYVTPIPANPTQVHAEKLNLHVTSGDLRAWVFGETKQVPWGSIIVKFVVAFVLLCFAVACFANKRFILGFILLAVAVGMMIDASGLITLALIGLLSAFVAFRRFKSSHPVQGGVLATIALVILVGSVANWHAQHKAPATRFSPLFGSGQLNCASILDKHKNGVFLSTEPGLVLWSFPRNTPLENFATEAREFALDSDLILGAVSSSDQLVIVGRERTTPVAQLPPLRNETILLLASAREDELSQSYERRNPLAGRYDIQNRMDWAPIYLSPRLIDTEYGSLLNITDQLLKGWSEHGQIHYVNFRYPDPPSYPFDDGIMKLLKTNELTYNWNTKGTGYVVQMGPYELYALNKTGSLPVDYLAKGRPDVQSAEDTAYSYYSGLSDPNLVRVVQYAAIYQIFHHFGIVASQQPQPASADYSSPLRQPIRGLLEDIASVSDETINHAVLNGHREEADEVRNLRDDLRRLARMDSNGSLQQILVRALASRDGMKAVYDQDNQEIRETLFSIIGRVQDLGYVFRSPAELDRVRAAYEWQVNSRNSRWIHTPSIVESQGHGSAVGGHNLSSLVTIYQADEDVSAGQVLVKEANGKRVIHYNPADDSKVGETVRAAARDETKTAEEVQANIEHSLGSADTPPVSMRDGLGFDAEIHPETLRGFQTNQAPGPLSDIGWRRSQSTLADSDAKLLHRLGGNKNRTILVARGENGTYVISAPPLAPVQACDLASSTDAFLALTRDSSEGGVSVHFRGFDGRQAEGFLRNLDDHTDLHATIGSTEKDVSPEELTAILNKHYDISKAEIVSDPQVVLAEDGHTREVVTDLKVPARESGVRDLILTIRMKISEMFELTQQRLADISVTIREIVLKMSGQTDDVRDITQGLIAELRKNKTFDDVRAEVKHDNKTLFYVHREKPFEWIQTTDFAA
jgi:hypothetical protein